MNLVGFSYWSFRDDPGQTGRLHSVKQSFWWRRCIDLAHICVQQDARNANAARGWLARLALHHNGEILAGIL